MSRSNSQECTKLDTILKQLAEILKKPKVLETDQKEIKDKLQGINTRKIITEEEIGNLKVEMIGKLNQENENCLLKRLDDLENQLKRNNIVLLGVCDVNKKDERRSMGQFMEDFLAKYAGLPKMEAIKSHRSGAR